MKIRLYADEFPAFYTENTAPRSLLPGLKRINTRLSVSTIFFFIQKEIPDSENPERIGVQGFTKERLDSIHYFIWNVNVATWM